MDITYRAYALGYHDGRRGQNHVDELQNIDLTRRYYNQGLRAGIHDRNRVDIFSAGIIDLRIPNKDKQHA